jgi:hypothetical protein
MTMPPPNPKNLGLSPAGQQLGDQLRQQVEDETDDERKRRMAQQQQQGTGFLGALSGLGLGGRGF